MRYLVKARVKPGCDGALLRAIESGTLGQGSVAEGEYLRNMKDARLDQGQAVRWVEVCYCPSPAARRASLLGEIFRIDARARCPRPPPLQG